jgi:hypothetical protein
MGILVLEIIAPQPCDIFQGILVDQFLQPSQGIDVDGYPLVSSNVAGSKIPEESLFRGNHETILMVDVPLLQYSHL